MHEGHNNGLYNKMSYCRLMLICFFITGVFIVLYLFYDYNNQFRFSVKSGFYDEPFELQILGSKKYDVYYTIDGSMPTVDSIKYEDAIRIVDRNPEANEYSDRYDISTGYYSDEIAEYSYSVGDPGYVLPKFDVDKCTVVRAGIFDNSGKCINEISGVYFVGSDKIDRYDDITIVSIAADPYDLFDYYDGIYVTGKDFDDYLWLAEKIGYDEFWWSSYWYMWPANYKRTGIESEREARIDIYNQEQGTIISENCGIRIQGNGSRGKLPRNIKIISREEYSGSDYFSKDLLGNGEDLHKYILFGGADDNIFKIKDYLANSMEHELNFATMEFKPCVLFLEGEYWGTYYITEDYDEDYIQSYYNVPNDDVVIWKEGEIDQGTDEDLALYTNMETFISENDMSIAENYNKACEMIDITSFADYYAAQIFIGRCGDWPGGNEAAWRSRSINPNSKYQDGKWRWMLFDLNSEDGALEIEQLKDDTLETAIGGSSLLSSLLKNDEFKSLFCSRIQYIEKNIYTEDKVNEFIDGYLQDMLDSLCLSNMRFYSDEKRNDIIENAENIRTFLIERHKYINKSIEEHFGEEYLR